MFLRVFGNEVLYPVQVVMDGIIEGKAGVHFGLILCCRISFLIFFISKRIVGMGSQKRQ